MRILDCTLRDGGNVVGKGFSIEYTKSIIKGLISCGITDIEMGNCTGIGTYKTQKGFDVPSDLEYLEAVREFVNEANIGMFCGYKNGSEENAKLAEKYGLKFLRVGANAGDGELALNAVKNVKKAGLKCYYSLMKAYVLDPEQLAQEAKMLADNGVDVITIMDSAGTMKPEEVSKYVSRMVETVDIPVGFHGHNNLGLSIANALSACKAGASYIDGGLLFMARSAGNCSTEIAATLLNDMGVLNVDLSSLYRYEEEELIPMMEKYKYPVAIKPLDIVLGITGTHSSYTQLFKDVSREFNVDLYDLIRETSKINRKDPDRSLMEQVAGKLAEKNRKK